MLFYFPTVKITGFVNLGAVFRLGFGPMGGAHVRGDVSRSDAFSANLAFFTRDRTIDLM